MLPPYTLPRKRNTHKLRQTAWGRTKYAHDKYAFMLLPSLECCTKCKGRPTGCNEQKSRCGQGNATYAVSSTKNQGWGHHQTSLRGGDFFVFPRQSFVHTEKQILPVTMALFHHWYLSTVVDTGNRRHWILDRKAKVQNSAALPHAATGSSSGEAT